MIDTGDASLIGASVALAVVGCVLVVVVIVAIILLWIRHRNRLGLSSMQAIYILAASRSSHLLHFVSLLPHFLQAALPSPPVMLPTLP